jgi:predicted HTH transcriptional regulator
MAVARVIAAFANGVGGTLVIGYVDTEKLRADRYRLRGVDPTMTLEGIRVALEAVEPKPDVESHVVEVDGKSVVLAKIKSSEQFPVLAGGIPYYRQGAWTFIAPGERFIARVTAAAHNAEIRDALKAFSSTMDRQVQVITGLHALSHSQAVDVQRLRKASGWQRQLIWVLVGAVVGAILGVAATAIFGA